ncbi:outer membrane beta-barrel protein [Alcaligenaceae bacterium CGII-47]|nr:outer membrane beta-barrel protein [Alcaligenaceae bacterium CGII-47]
MNKLTALGLALLFCCSAAAEPPSSEGVYVGLFGGLGALESSSLRQQGQVYLPHPLPPLPIDAKGNTDHANVSLGGIQLGYEWDRHLLGRSGWGLRPAAEIEATYLGKHTPTGTMPVHPRALGTQYVTVPMTGQTFLANAILTVQTPYSKRFFPYVGAGAGLALLSIKGSDSANPSEPGINHFNSKPDASSSALALQFKAGIKGQLSRNIYLFTEYRYLQIDATHYTFGRTDYPGVHLPTDTWSVNMGRLKYNLFVAGVQYRF